MIKINNKEYKNYEQKIEYTNFKVTTYGVKKEGVSPIIKLLVEDKILIRIETILSKDILLPLENHSSIDISRFITDISYEDEDGWTSIITGLSTAKLIKENNKYNIELNVNEEVELTLKLEISLFDEKGVVL